MILRILIAVAAIGAMMALATQGAPGREGVRMGLWGAAQAVAFGLGGLLGAAASDVARRLIGTPGEAYATVFALEGLLFLVAAALAWRVAVPAPAAISRAASAARRVVRGDCESFMRLLRDGPRPAGPGAACRRSRSSAPAH